VPGWRRLSTADDVDGLVADAMDLKGNHEQSMRETKCSRALVCPSKGRRLRRGLVAGGGGK
jgi:hypothetical protein